MADLLAKYSTLLTEDFLLQSDAAKKLYHGYAASLPIIDYHNHLPVNEIAEKKKFKNLTEIWLKGDHYKWRAMRTLGIREDLITGSDSDEQKFHAGAAYVPQTIHNPLFHWTLLELNDPFQVKQYLNTDSAGKIYSHCNEQLSDDKFSTTGLLSHFKVEVTCTTDDPCDDLRYHNSIAQSAVFTKVLPGFRPDKVFNITNKVIFKQYLQKLEIASGRIIVDFDSIGDQSQANSLSVFLNELDKTNELARTILFNVNPADNELFAAMTGNFNDGIIKGKIQFGSGWWFLDQIDAMTKQLNALSSIGMISTFIGMLTDSRSFLSFSRHEDFRRLVCNMFGSEIEAGLLPNHEKWIGQIIQNICYHNAKQYLSLNDAP